MSYLRRVGVPTQALKQTEGFSERTKEPKQNGPSRASCERGRSARLARLGGPSSHARKPPAKKAEGSAKEEAAGAEHVANSSTIAPWPKEGSRHVFPIKTLVFGAEGSETLGARSVDVIRRQGEISAERRNFSKPDWPLSNERSRETGMLKQPTSLHAACRSHMRSTAVR